MGAINNINTIIRKSVIGIDAEDTNNIDQTMIEIDGTENKSKLGANAILGVSIASARAAAIEKNIFLYEFIGEKMETSFSLPLPT